MKLLVINNLTSGFGDGSVYDFIRSFTEDNDEIVIRNIRETADIKNMLHDADQFEVVVSAGGDQTAAAISYCLANTKIPILPFPSGTFNIISQNLTLPNEPHALANVVRECKTMDFDIGEITVNGKKYPFSTNAGIGYGTKIHREANPNKKKFGFLAYVGAAISNFKPQKANFKIKLDDGIIVETEGIGIMIMNFSRIGLDLSVTHTNKPRDGKFDVIILKAKNAFDYIPALTAAALDNAINFPDRSPAIEVYQSSYVEVSAEPNMEIQTDGKPKSITSPFIAQIIKHGARYVVNNECLQSYKGN